jgi:hypothetical protein
MPTVEGTVELAADRRYSPAVVESIPALISSAVTAADAARWRTSSADVASAVSYDVAAHAMTSSLAAAA